MTVSYQYDVASSSTAGFFRLLWRWRGSIWKLLYKELLLFLAVYMCIAFTYDFLMTDYYKKYYEHIVIFCSAFVEVIPLSFILGFYVSFTATRWWQQYTAIPWPDKLMNIIALYIPGNDVTSRVLRRTLMRYLNLTLVLVLRSISIPVKRRFPTKEHLVEAGFMSRPELEIYQSVPSHEFNTFWIPCTWFVNLLREAKSECRITDSGGIKLIMEEFNEFRSKCGLLWSYDWVSIPLVYTQVVTLSTQAFFLASLLGRQHINSAKPHIYGEYYIPIFTMLQFILYMGLLKLGEQLINPFGDDDEDFELNWIIDRHLKVSFLGVDILNSDPPPLIKDNYFDEMDIKLPYTEAAVAHKVKTYRGSVAAFHVPTDKHGLVIPEFEDDNNADSDDEPSTIQSNRDAVSRNNSWSLFNQRKRKLSSSFDSFNSELMVETGLSESEMPELVSTHSSWPTFLRSEQQRQQQSMIDGENNNNNNNYPITTSPTTSSMPESLSSKLSVWPINCRQEQRKANEDTQGIRWSENDGPKDEENNDNKNRQQQQQQQPIQQQLQSVDRRQPELYKQSSFSTSDSSIVIPMGETTSQWPDANSTARIFRPRKSPLQVFSKEMANAPISVFNQILESNLRRQSKNSSLSSLGSTTSPKIMNEQQSGHRTYKPYKSLMKSSRQVDPKLRIRPFRSKVTFSVDTKNDDNTLQIRGRGFNFQYDSSSESNSSLMKAAHPESSEYPQYFRSTLKRSTPPLPPSSSATAGTPFSLKTMQDSSFHENSKRRQSMDPTIYQRDKPVSIIDENKQDNWLHYQSLPNIQEEELIPLSSSFNDAAPSIPGGSDSLTIGKSNITKQQQQPYQPQQSQPKLPQNIQSGKPEESKQISPSSSPKILLEMNPLSRSPSSMNIQRISSLDVSEPGRKKSFKRQKSQEISDEDLKIRLSYPLTAPSSSPTISCDKSIMKKQSSSDSQGSNTSATNNKTMIVPPVGILKKKNDQKISTTLKQASTESDTGSYHTVRSLILNPSSSSIDSFTSAVSDSINNSNDNNKNSESNNDKDQIKKSPTTPTPTELSSSSSAGLLTDNRLLSFTTLESSLVPKIIFSQSTPSVTSQSSDDQNSPKWYDDDKNEDDRYYSEFSSLETVIHGNILSSDDNKTDQDNNSDNSNDRTLCKQKHKQQQKQPKKSSITSTTSSTSPPKSSTSSSSSSTSSSTSSSSTLNKSSLNKKNSIKR